jgi:hypothetical protein
MPGHHDAEDDHPLDLFFRSTGPFRKLGPGERLGHLFADHATAIL